MMKYLFLATLFAVVSWPVFPVEIPQAPIDDAPVEGVSAGSDSTVPSGKRSMVDFRLFSIGTFSFQPISDLSHPAVASGMFAEKSFTALLNFDLTLKPEAKGNSGFVFRTDVEAVVSTLFPEDAPLFEQNYGDYIRLDEIFAEWNPVSPLSILAGKYRHIFSPGMFQNPLDRHNPTSTLPGEPAAREGAWMAMLSYDAEFASALLSRLRVSLAWLPGFFMGTDGIPAAEREIRLPDAINPAGYVTQTESWEAKYMGAFARVYLGLFQGDLNLVYYYTEEQNQAGLSYSRYFNNYMEVHGEILFYDNPRSLYTLAPERDFYQDFLTGIRLDLDSNFSIILEYLYRGENPEYYPASLADRRLLWLGLAGADTNSQALTPLRDYIVLTLMLMNVKDVLDVSFNVVGNLINKEALFSLRTDLKMDKSSKLSLAGVFKAGDETTFFGSYLPFDYQVRLEYYIALF